MEREGLIGPRTAEEKNTIREWGGAAAPLTFYLALLQPRMQEAADELTLEEEEQE